MEITRLQLVPAITKSFQLVPGLVCDAVLGLGLDISQARRSPEAANVASTAPDGTSVYTNSVSTEEAAVLT